MTILIVEDDAGIRTLLRMFLVHNGYTAVPVPHGLAALEHLQQDEPLPELILLDMIMPVMDGAAFRRTQQDDARLAEIPVIVMSGAENLNAQVRTLAADAYLPKPFDFAALLKLVERYCGQSRQRGCDYSIQQ
jgi:DNA-binding response OmpR family regulator